MVESEGDPTCFIPCSGVQFPGRLGVSRKSKDLCAQAGHIREPVEVKVTTYLPLEGYFSFEVQSAKEVNTPQSKSKQKT